MRGVQISTILTQQDHQKLSITKMKHPLLDRWVRVLSSINPGKPVPNINTATTKNMSVTVLEQLRDTDPELYQSVFAKRIEDVEDARLQQHLYDQKFWTDDEDALRENGFEFFANNIRDEKVRYEQEKINKAIEESRARQEKQRQINEERANMPLIEKLALESQGQTMDQVIRNRMKYHGRID